MQVLPVSEVETFLKHADAAEAISEEVPHPIRHSCRTLLSSNLLHYANCAGDIVAHREREQIWWAAQLQVTLARDYAAKAKAL